MQSVCGGFYKTMMALRMDGRLRFPNVEFDSEKVGDPQFREKYSMNCSSAECFVTLMIMCPIMVLQRGCFPFQIRFEHRFEAFQTVATPRVVTYEQYCEINDLSKYGNLTPGGMYDAASKCFKQVKKDRKNGVDPVRNILHLSNAAMDCETALSGTFICFRRKRCWNLPANSVQSNKPYSRLARTTWSLSTSCKLVIGEKPKSLSKEAITCIFHWSNSSEWNFSLSFGTAPPAKALNLQRTNLVLK